MNPAFTLPFLGDDEQIRRQIQRGEKDYFKRPVRYAANSKEADEMALSAGTRIREGERTKENLKVIFHWKNESSRFYKSKLEPAFDRNHADCVARALRLAHEAKTEEDAILALTELWGVQVPTASAMLANIYPDRFTVIDTLALRALGMHNPEIALYRSYNDACLGLAKQFSVCVRTLDRALWEWGKTHTPKRPLRTSGA
jgi:hypothetical protein